MTDTLQSSTLRLRRPLARNAAITRPKAAAVSTVCVSTASVAISVASGANAERSLKSDALLQGRSHMSIMHNEETYQLRATPLVWAS
ncbi:Hemin uptake protein [Candidatus Burkholderia brachyanthoides]|nr:Hemin uptake protein [Candidatus Burkholderia brachyanthoides]